jgi:cytochrome c-type biogenesis protein
MVRLFIALIIYSSTFIRKAHSFTPSHVHVIDAPSSFVRCSPSSPPLIQRKQQRHCPQLTAPNTSFQRKNKQKRSSLLAMPSSGIEDFVFTAQNAASTLANKVINSNSNESTTTTNIQSLQSLLLLYTAGLWTSFSPCSLGLLPITVSYITTAANERRDKNTILPTISFAIGLALVFTALGVSASALGGVFGSSNSGSSGGGEGGELRSLLVAAASSLVGVVMGLQLLELINVPLPSLDFRLRNAALNGVRGEEEENGRKRKSGDGGSLFDKNGGLVLDNLQSSREETVNGEEAVPEETDDGSDNNNDERASLLRIFLLGGTSALVASPCATPVLASLLAYLASASSSMAASSGDVSKGAAWMLSYTLGYCTPLLIVGATGGQALVNLQKNSVDGQGVGSWLGQWVTPLTGGVLIVFGMNGFLVALLGDPSLAGLAPIIE